MSSIAPQDNPDNPWLAAALAYAQRGWPVLPCHTPQFSGCTCALKRGPCPQRGLPGHSPLKVQCSCSRAGTCQNVGKHPRTWNGLKDATIEPHIISKWWHRWPEANVALVTGKPSGIVVLDVDSRHGGDLSLEELSARHGKLPDTVGSLTGGGGRHLCLAHPGGGTVIRNAVGLAGFPGLDIRGDGGYIVAPPSLHASSRHYEWEASSHPANVPLAPMPDWLLALLTSPKSRRPGPPPSAEPRIPAGQRNNTLTSLAGTMRRRGMTQAAIFAALAAENAACCDPPLPKAEVWAIACSMARYPAAEKRPSPFRHDRWLGPQAQLRGIPLAIHKIDERERHG
jgi:hypothetical protein